MFSYHLSGDRGALALGLCGHDDQPGVESGAWDWANTGQMPDLRVFGLADYDSVSPCGFTPRTASNTCDLPGTF